MGPEEHSENEKEVTDEHTLIGAEGTEAPGEQRRSGEARQRELDEQLDAALACTFPASDPIGCLGGDPGCPPKT